MPLRYSTGCVRDYIANCGAGPDLPEGCHGVGTHRAVGNAQVLHERRHRLLGDGSQMSQRQRRHGPACVILVPESLD